MRGEGVFARLAAAALLIVAATTLISLEMLTPGLSDAGPWRARAPSLDLLAAATRL